MRRKECVDLEKVIKHDLQDPEDALGNMSLNDTHQSNSLNPIPTNQGIELDKHLGRF